VHGCGGHELRHYRALPDYLPRAGARAAGGLPTARVGGGQG